MISTTSILTMVEFINRMYYKQLKRGLNMNDNKDKPDFYIYQLIVLAVIYVLALHSVGILDVISRGTL